MPEDESSPKPPPSTIGPPAFAPPGPPPGPPARLVALALAAGVLAGAASWLIGEATLTAFRPPYVVEMMMGQATKRSSFEDQSAADLKNAALAYAVLGASLGTALGLAGGLARGSVRSGVIAAGAGALLGGSLTTLGSMAALPFYFRALKDAQEDLSRDLILPLLVHAASWAAAGLAGGLAFGVGLGGGRTRLINAALGGLVGAMLGTVAYEMIGASAFPSGKTTDPISATWATRLIARLAVAVLASVVTAIVVDGAAGKAVDRPRRA